MEKTEIKFFQSQDQRIVITHVNSDAKFIDNYFVESKIQRHPLFEKDFCQLMYKLYKKLRI